VSDGVSVDDGLVRGTSYALEISGRGRRSARESLVGWVEAWMLT
jgi:hypothetical protein